MGQIRKFRLEDLNQVMELQQAVAEDLGIEFDLRTSTQSTLNYIDLPGTVVLVAELDGKIIGYIAAIGVESLTAKDLLTFKEVGWYVYPEHRNGVGIQLLKALEKVIKQVGGELHVASPAKYPTLGKYFKKLGYTEIETTYKKRI